VSGVIDDDMLKALARFTGPVTQCPAGKASQRIKQRRATRSSAARETRIVSERRGGFYRCDVCHMWHKVGFNYKRDGEMIEEVNDGIKQLAEPPTQWVWYTLPSDAEEAA
jgi:hypothetical protein